MRSLRTEDEIISNWKGEINQPVLSISCITYNHESYIEDALEGFLIQETQYRFEIIVYDDASTDGTAKIIKEYANKYPRIINPIYQCANQYSLGVSPLRAYVLPMAKGGYLAACDGDDYWEDKEKIEKQVRYLEDHPDISISGHAAKVMNDFTSEVYDEIPHDHQRRDFCGEDVIKGLAWLPTLTLVWRKNAYIENCIERDKVLNRDFFLISLAGRVGGSHFHDDILPAVYRQHQSGIWTSLDAKAKAAEGMITRYWMYKYFKKEKMNHYADYYLSELFMMSAPQIPTKTFLKEAIKRFIPKEILVAIMSILRKTLKSS